MPSSSRDRRERRFSTRIAKPTESWTPKRHHAKPRHADLLAADLDDDTCIKYIDRFLM
jgi:hypothetical protein